MPSSYLSLNVHIVFSTKNRAPSLGPDIIHQAHDYIGGTLRGLGAVPLRIGGIEDHIHILVGIKGNHCVTDLVRETKKASTNWLKGEKGYVNFGWQDGYVAFSVSPERLGGVSKYIDSQDEHHQTKTYKDELIELLTFAKIPFDPTFLD